MAKYIEIPKIIDCIQIPNLGSPLTPQFKEWMKAMSLKFIQDSEGFIHIENMEGSTNREKSKVPAGHWLTALIEKDDIGVKGIYSVMPDEAFKKRYAEFPLNTETILKTETNTDTKKSAKVSAIELAIKYCEGVPGRDIIESAKLFYQFIIK